MSQASTSYRRLAVYLVALLAGFGVLLLVAQYIHKQRQEAEHTACLAAPACQEQLVQSRSLFQAKVMRANTGRLFFKGKACADDCSGNIGGYVWAEQLGVTKEAACSGKSESFQQGCLAYVHDRVAEIAEDNRSFRAWARDGYGVRD